MAQFFIDKGTFKREPDYLYFLEEKQKVIDTIVKEFADTYLEHCKRHQDFRYERYIGLEKVVTIDCSAVSNRIKAFHFKRIITEKEKNEAHRLGFQELYK